MKTQGEKPNTLNDVGFQRRPIYLEKYKKMSFIGIPGFPRPISNDLRDKVIKFSGNNAITSEEYLRKFIDMLNE